MNLLKNGSILVLFLLFCSFCFSYEPDEFLAKKTHLLEENEVPENIVTITKGDEEFYVVQITKDGETAGYIALQKSSPVIIEGEVKNKQLIQTAEFIVEYQGFKSEVRDNPALIWFIVNWGEVSTISSKISNEELELDLIRDTLNSATGNEIIGKMESKLLSIKTALEVLKKKMSSTDTLEGSFLTQPSVGGGVDLKNAVIECYSYLEQLHSLGLEYEALQQQLAIAIANNPKIDRETKQQLNKTADLPEQFSKIEKWFTSAQNMQLEKRMNSILQNASQSSSNYAKYVDSRLKRDEAFNELYTEREELKRETEYSTLQEAFEQINSEQLRNKWVEQGELNEFIQEWSRAETKFNKGDYLRAIEAAKKAEDSAIKVYTGGLKKEEPVFEFGLFFTGAVLLIVLLIILIIVRNRGKLTEFILGSEGEERVEFNDWV